MTLKNMQGFETMRDDSDFRTQGWTISPVKQQMAFAPSLTGVAGESMRILGPSTTNSTAPGAAGAQDPGYFNTGVTVNQAWLAGGCTFGFWGKFNGAVSASYGAGTTTVNGACFDGTRYWAIRAVGSTYNVAYTSDFVTWTITTNQPPVTLDASATVSYLGGGIIAIGRNATASTSYSVYYTNNLGASWSSQALITGASSAIYGCGIATGNSTYPHAWLVEGTTSYVYVGTVGGTMTQVASIATSSPNVCVTPKINGNILSFLIGQGTVTTVFSADVTNASLNTTGAWSTATLAGISFPSALVYNATSNLWVLSSSGASSIVGVSTFANTGSAGTAVSPTGAITVTQRYSTAGITSLFKPSTLMVGLGLAGHIVTSPDGITWTEAGSHIIPVGTTGIDWRCALYDGTRYVAFSDATTGVVATSADLINGWQAQYVMEPTEQSAITNGYGHTGFYSGTAPNAATGLWTLNAGWMSVAVTALSAGVRGLALVNSASGRETTVNIANAGTQLTHYYELVCVAAAGANNFTHSIYVDGTILYQGTTITSLASSTSDTTSLIILTLEKFATFTAYDDMYFCLNDGVGISGTMGSCNIMARRPTNDVQAQWTKVGSAASNSLSINKAALSSQSSTYLTSSNVGDKDIYASTDAIPAGFTPKAIQLEATLSRSSATNPTVNIGIISGSTETDSATVSVGAGTTFISQVVQLDPNGNKAWTSASIIAAQMTANHVS